MKDWDFCGYATKNDTECSDGRIIRQDAFAHNDGMKVPVVWNHQHNDISQVLGHCVLENRKDGVFAYGSFNNTAGGIMAKEAVAHGDVESLSIYANQLLQKGHDVLHGCIREVSLVLAGANPGAHIMDVSVAHSEDAEYDAQIFSGERIMLAHSEDDTEETPIDEPTEDVSEEGGVEEKDYQRILDSMTDEQRDVVTNLVGQALEDGAAEAMAQSAMVMDADFLEHADDAKIKDVIDTMSPIQRKVLNALVGMALDSKSEKVEGEDDMKHNIFDNDMVEEGGVLQHSMDVIQEAIADGKKYGSMKDAFLAHGIDDLRISGTETYGVKGISALFPDAKAINSGAPEFIKRPTEWVDIVMAGVKHTPFSRVKTMFADITADAARAKGYTKGKKKVEEVISLLKRTTIPTTVYKKQKLDRDDALDITEFDMIPWLKGEMRMMLDEEIARAILIGDGRTTGTDDKIDENCIRPIWTDNDLFTIRKDMTYTSTMTDNDKARLIIQSAIRARKDYRGSGNPVFFTTEDTLATLLLFEDTNGRRIYESEAALASAMRVSKIVTVSVMENKTTSDGKALVGIIVNLSDYNVGADKGGAVNLFDDFDIDYNQMKYLIETRCSGALVKPFSAIALQAVTASGASE